MKQIELILVFLVFFGIISFSYSEEKCIVSYGVGYGSEREEAIKSAKVEAIAHVVGVKVKHESVSEKTQQNEDFYKMFHYVSFQETQGFIKDYTVLEDMYDSERKNYRVKIKACVYPDKIKEKINEISKKDKVFLNIKGKYLRLTSLIKSILTAKLEEQDFQVYEKNMTPDSLLLDGEVFLYKVFSPDDKIGNKKIDFYVVKIIFNFSLKKKGKVLISDSITEKGVALTEKEAEITAVKQAVQLAANSLIKKLNSKIKGERFFYYIEFKGVSSGEVSFRLKEELSNIPFVESVEEIETGKFRVRYKGKVNDFINSVRNRLHIRLVEKNLPFLTFSWSTGIFE